MNMMTREKPTATSLESVLLWFEIQQLQERYCAALDNDRLEEWAALFTADCLYEIVPKENADMGLPIGVIYCDNQRMLRDRVLSLRHANIYEEHASRHMTSGLQLTHVDEDTVDAQSSYVVVQTRTNGESFVYQAGRYLDRVVRTPEGWRYQKRRVIYDTSRVQTLLATPI
ncbi:anthranilate 1,2-dioxygenase small subunit AndAd [Variovorax sp. J22P168]|uniref:anthranilate 1,2-dioxygenase small subunit AndAd n=1 Tax=Variovorax jilinensis TaxID=3053513 RepID=UPI0025777B24|nr:anthranilate 1,2-dioxygenase small subunit AndAd [Variovorax sp. J22P168]MDM0012968.1 anthranilate 1,2-dioxygenase small subunit AndAd [Variovorax sp. J22P168]